MCQSVGVNVLLVILICLQIYHLDRGKIMVHCGYMLHACRKVRVKHLCYMQIYDFEKIRSRGLTDILYLIHLYLEYLWVTFQVIE